jgi:anti-sigma regulatory factor (Ser/Thr protein kinase)
MSEWVSGDAEWRCLTISTVLHNGSLELRVQDEGVESRRRTVKRSLAYTILQRKMAAGLGWYRV